MALSNIEQLFVYPKMYSTSGGIELSNFVSKVITRNELSYNASPTRMNDMTLVNDEEAFYVPTIEFEINYLTPDLYANLMQYANSKGFVVFYMDQEMQEMVYRSMYMTEQSIDNLVYGMTNSVDGIVSVKVKMVSRYGYPYTKSTDADHFTAQNKYHYYQLYAHRGFSTLVPDGAEVPDYV